MKYSKPWRPIRFSSNNYCSGSYLKAQLRGIGLCMLSLLTSVVVHAQEKRKIHEVQVIKFDNYGVRPGEEKIFNKRYLQDTTGLDVAPVFDISFCVLNFSFPPSSDTLLKTIAHQTTPQFKPAEFDSKKRIVHYYRNAFEHYTFEYNALGNLQYIKRWGAKHVTAQMTFVYFY
jgi:hypothetical protein